MAAGDVEMFNNGSRIHGWSVRIGDRQWGQQSWHGQNKPDRSIVVSSNRILRSVHGDWGTDFGGHTFGLWSRQPKMEKRSQCSATLGIAIALLHSRISKYLNTSLFFIRRLQYSQILWSAWCVYCRQTNSYSTDSPVNILFLPEKPNTVCNSVSL